MEGLEEQYIGGGWIPPFLGECTEAASEEPATATKSSPLASSTSTNTEPAAKKRRKGE